MTHPCDLVEAINCHQYDIENIYWESLEIEIELFRFEFFKNSLFEFSWGLFELSTANCLLTYDLMTTLHFINNQQQLHNQSRQEDDTQLGTLMDFANN